MKLSSSTLSENQGILSVTYIFSSILSEIEMVVLIKRRFKLAEMFFPRLVLDIPMMLQKSSVKQRYTTLFAYISYLLLLILVTNILGCTVKYWSSSPSSVLFHCPDFFICISILWMFFSTFSRVLSLLPKYYMENEGS